ncbi:MAG: hypothetical protein ACFFG0_42360 [Candidatus Thorarchaeota archaeon]
MIIDKINHLAGIYLLSPERVSDIVACIILDLEDTFDHVYKDFEKWELTRIYDKDMKLNLEDYLLFKQIDEIFLMKFISKLKTMNSIEVN